MPRKQKKYHYIYKTINLLSGKYYIGMHSTSNLDDGYMGSGKRLTYSINKYGKENHVVEILEFVNSREELKKREKEIVNLNEIAKVDCMNLKVGGEGGGGIHHKEHGEKFARAGNLAAEKTRNNQKRLKWLRENDIGWFNDLKKKISNASKIQNAKQVVVKDKLGNKLIVSRNDSRYISGELIHFNIGSKRSIETKNKMKNSSKKRIRKIYIYSKNENKQIYKNELKKYLKEGWKKGKIQTFYNFKLKQELKEKIKQEKIHQKFEIKNKEAKESFLKYKNENYKSIRSFAKYNNKSHTYYYNLWKEFKVY